MKPVSGLKYPGQAFGLFEQLGPFRVVCNVEGVQ
jgi:hypothetical protein